MEPSSIRIVNSVTCPGPGRSGDRVSVVLPPSMAVPGIKPIASLPMLATRRDAAAPAPCAPDSAVAAWPIPALGWSVPATKRTDSMVPNLMVPGLPPPALAGFATAVLVLAMGE